MSGTLQATILKDGASSTNNLTFDSSGNATVGNNLTVTGTSTLNGNTSVTGTITGSSTIAAATGTLYPIVSGTAQASTSGTSITFTGIPSWVKRITVMIANLTCNTTSTTYLLQVGSGSVTTTGYASQAWTTSGLGVVTSGFALAGNGASASYALSGLCFLTLVGSNTWAQSSSIAYTNVTSVGYLNNGYTPALSGALDRVVLTTTGGTATFTSGTINILYE